MQRGIWGAAVCLGTLVLLAACDTAPGPEALDQRPPVLSDFSLSPQQVAFDQLPPDQIDGDVVRIPLEFSVAARATDRPIREVAFVVQSPTSSTTPVAMGTLTSAGGDRYTGSTTIEISAVEVATYPILVYAVDKANRASGEVRGQLVYTRTFDPGSPPVIDDVEAPDSVTRPAPGDPAVVFQYVAVVSDPDGLSDVAEVEVDIESVGTLRLCDDGGVSDCNAGFPASGDATAGDGRFTLTLQVDSNNQPATLMLRFKATDRAGLESEVVERSFTIQ